MPGKKEQPFADEAQLVGVAEVGARLSISAERVRQLAKSGEMPEPVGRLGRQLIWQWSDVEAWARQAGRLSGVAGDGQQAMRARRRSTSGGLRLVVDEVMDWGRNSENACHVRIWAPPSGSTESHVVVLGHLNELGGVGLTNDIESAAMAASRRFLGSSWKQARFYEYTPAGPLSEGDEFRRVTFTVREHRQGMLGRARGLRDADLIKALGGQLLDPTWRKTTVEEIEQLTGDILQTWMPGAYTGDLIKMTSDLTGTRHEVIWDPARAREHSRLAATLVNLNDSDSGLSPESAFGINLGLAPTQLELALAVVAHATLAAIEQSEQDARTQPADTAIWLSPPDLSNKAELFVVAERHLVNKIDPEQVWQLTTDLRGAIVAAHTTLDNHAIMTQQQLLVPGVHGGWAQVAWFDANVEEPVPEREGWLGPIAIPRDLVTLSQPPTSQPSLDVDPFDQLVLLIDTLIAHLEGHWDLWSAHDVPSFKPSVALSATGPLTRSYLDSIEWLGRGDIDQQRLQRLEGVIRTGRSGIDPDGSLVSVTRDGNEFACEWPVSGAPDATLALATIRADRPARGPTPVFVERSDGHLQLLPSAPDRFHGNSFTWGYPGTGPSNLAAAALDLLRRADGCVNLDAAEESVRNLAISPHVPNWPIEDLLGRIVSTSERVTGRQATGA